MPLPHLARPLLRRLLPGAEPRQYEHQRRRRERMVAITLDQTRIEVAPEVEYVLTAISTVPGETTSAGTLDGHPFGLRAGEFFIGPKDYGKPPAGAVVHVRQEGVHFGLEPRGELPAPIPSE